MKIRSGFVSNSSSSSFVMVGTEINDKILEKLSEKINLDSSRPDIIDAYIDSVNTSTLYPYPDNKNIYLRVVLDEEENKSYLGYQLAEGDYGFDEFDIDFNEVIKLADKIKELTGAETKLVVGTRWN